MKMLIVLSIPFIILGCSEKPNSDLKRRENRNKRIFRIIDSRYSETRNCAELLLYEDSIDFNLPMPMKYSEFFCLCHATNGDFKKAEQYRLIGMSKAMNYEDSLKCIIAEIELIQYKREHQHVIDKSYAILHNYKLPPEKENFVRFKISESYRNLGNLDSAISSLNVCLEDRFLQEKNVLNKWTLEELCYLYWLKGDTYSCDSINLYYKNQKAAIANNPER